MGRRLATGVLAAAVLLSGCAGVPVKGRVVSAGKVAAGSGDDRDLPRDFPVRRIPAGPGSKALPATVVTGYLDAQASFDGDHGVARSFLAPDARWDAGGDAVIVDDHRTLGTPHVVGDRAELVVTMRRRGFVTVPSGEYRPVRATNLPVRFTLAKVNGEWRITDPPSGIFVSIASLGQAFRRVTLYFPDFTRQRLVPAPLFLPHAVETPFVATVVHALLGGPPPTLAPAVKTAIPADTELIDVPAGNDTLVTVNLSREVRRASTQTLPLLAAQLVWTLTEPGLGFTDVRLLVEGAPLMGKRAPRTADRSDFVAYSPEPAPGDDRVFFLRNGRMQAIDDSGVVKSARSDGGFVATSVSRSGLELAVLKARPGGRRQLAVGRLGNGPLRDGPTATRLTAPSWAPGGDAVWTVAQGDGPAKVYVMSVRGDPLQTVRTPNLGAAGAVQSFQLAPDGARALLVAGHTLWQAYVQPQTDGIQLALRRILDDVTDVSAATWDTPTRLIFVGRMGGKAGLYHVDYDGFGLAAVAVDGLPQLPDGLAGGRGAGGLPLLAEVRGQIWRRERSGEWTQVTAGVGPVYAG